MKILSLTVLMLISLGVQAIEICVAPMPLATKGDRSLSNPTGRDKPYNLSVHIQDRVVLQGLDTSDCFTYSNDENIKVVVKNQNKAVESFFINPNNRTNGACIWFKSMYETWSVWDLDESKHLCVVSTEQGN